MACVPIAIFCNIVRVTTTGFFLVLGHAEWARGFWHTMLGLGMLLIAFALYGGISYVLAHMVEDSGPQAGREADLVAAGDTMT
jgi:exosortase/archaeosortase family protein